MYCWVILPLNTFSWGLTDSSEVETSISLLAEMTHTLSRTGFGRNCCVYRQQKPRTEKICHYSGSRIKSPGLRTCLTFCFKDQARMEQQEPPVDSNVEATEGRLRQLASKWFVETQVPLIVHNGFFPTWFLGFITRKETEDILREKELGCFLIRLSDKAIGYILSYKGRDRCRHFMITQSESGQFVVCGDTERHASVSDLIEYYKTRLIQPFGEYLTSSCFEAPDKQLYDTIQVSPEEKPSVGAVNNIQEPQSNSKQPPARPPRGNRTLEEVPPLPRRSRLLDSGPLNDPDRVLYAQLRKQSPREIPRSQHIYADNYSGDDPGRAGRSTIQDQSRCSPPPEPVESVYSELSLLDSTSRSLPLLDNGSDGEQNYRLRASPHTPPRLSPKHVKATRFDPLPERTDPCMRASSSHSLEYMSDSAVYHLAGRPCSPHTMTSGTRYAEAPNEGGRFQHDDTYEMIPDNNDTHKPNSSTYEPLEDMRPKHNHSSWGLKNEKWKWLFPEAKRKW